MNLVKNKSLTKIAFKTLGCKVNFTETEQIAKKFKLDRYHRVDSNEIADIYVFNTCSVTENADSKFKNLVKKTHKLNKNAFIAVIGCYAQLKTSEISKIDGVDLVLGASEKFNLDLFIGKRNKEKIQKTYSCSIDSFKNFNSSFSDSNSSRTRSFLKIQDGCDFYCAFCIIPFARGPARSRDYKNIISDAKALIGLGVKELVLTGINLGTYENNGCDFYDVLESLLSIDSNVRIRISSIEPTTIDERLLKFWQKYPNFCRYLHLPIQSATNEILDAMRRKYSLDEYNDYIGMIKNQFSDLCLGTDIIIGFPGETDELFNQTHQFLLDSPIDYFHVFSYSERTMAHSRKFDDKVSVQSIKNRSLQLRQLSDVKWADYNSNFLGETVPVLFEQIKHNYWHGSTQHFLKVKCESNDNLKNKIRNVNLLRYEKGVLFGNIVDK